jgi:Protein of unknown function (DUF4013)
MSSPFASGQNPYAAPVMPPAPIPVVPAGPLQTSLDYMRAYNYIFENPTWTTTVLLMGLACLTAIIPGVSIVLQLLIIGYQFETIDWLLKTQGRQYPTFDFARIGDYFGRGLWPFLVNLVASFVLIPVLYIGMIVAGLIVAGVASAAGDDLGPVLAVALGAIVVLVFFAAFVLVTFYLVAMMLRSGLAQDFGSAFQFAWLQDFVRRMWVDIILAGLFLMVTGVALYLVGLLALCIGLFFVIPLLMLASAHLLYQLYIVYLSRGGMPVPSKVAYPQPMLPPPMGGMPPGYPPKPPM